MIFCEKCRIKKGWPRSPGYPYTGFESNLTCEICHAHTDCHDVIGSLLVPIDKKTVEEKMVDKIMQQSYKEKAERLQITHSNGRLDHEMTEQLQGVILKRNDEVDWYATYLIRLKIQKEITK